MLFLGLLFVVWTHQHEYPESGGRHSPAGGGKGSSWDSFAGACSSRSGAPAGEHDCEPSGQQDALGEVRRFDYLATDSRLERQHTQPPIGLGHASIQNFLRRHDTAEPRGTGTYGCGWGSNDWLQFSVNFELRSLRGGVNLSAITHSTPTTVHVRAQRQFPQLWKLLKKEYAMTRVLLWHLCFNQSTTGKLDWLPGAANQRPWLNAKQDFVYLAKLLDFLFILYVNSEFYEISPILWHAMMKSTEILLIVYRGKQWPIVKLCKRIIVVS